MKKAQRKRCIKDDGQGGSRLSDQVSSVVKVAKNATKSVIKEEITAEVSTAAGSNRNPEHKKSATKRKRAGSADVPELVQNQVDSEVMHDTLPSRKRKTALTSAQCDKPSEEDRPTGRLVNKRQPSLKQRQSTRLRQSASEAQGKKASKEPLQQVSDTRRKKSTKVKRESMSPVDKTSVKTEKPDVAFTSAPHHSGRKFIGAHVSISGM